MKKTGSKVVCSGRRRYYNKDVSRVFRMSKQPISCIFPGLDVYLCDSEVSLLTQCNASSGVFKVRKLACADSIILSVYLGCYDQSHYFAHFHPFFKSLHIFFSTVLVQYLV